MTDLPETPFDHGVTAELIERLSGPVGMITLNWPFIEQSMAQITEATADPVAAEGVAVRRENGIGERLKYLRRIFHEVAALKPYRPRSERIFAALAPLTELRHWCSHGRISKYDAAAETVTFVRINPDRTRSHHTIRHIEVRVAAFDEAARVTLALATDIGRLAHDLVGAFVRR